MAGPAEDYYAILQVQPDADPEVIDAAYRQLMRKYHPDSAGEDRERAAKLHERAKSINRAYAVLRDPRQRWIYDRLARRGTGAESASRTTQAAPGTSQAQASASPRSGEAAGSAGSSRDDGGTTAPPEARGPARRAAYGGALAPLFDVLSSLYYLLPGPYEWERQQGTDLLATLMLPALGVAGWSLASGRLNWLFGQAPFAAGLAWVVLVLLALPLWALLPRLALASLPTVLLLTGPVEGLLHAAGVLGPSAWIAAGVVGIILSARLYLFAVLPTLLACWLLSNVGPGLAAIGNTLASLVASASLGHVLVVILAGVFILLSWLIVMALEQPTASAKPTPAPKTSADRQGSAPPEGTRQLFQRVSADRVCALQAVPLRTGRDYREPPSTTLRKHQEANVLLVLPPWAFVQTDDGREGWAEWRVPG